MAFSYNKKNLANTTITGAITPAQTSVTVADATVFSYAFFYATLMPSNEMSNASNSEIVLVTNIQGNTLTLVRGQENTIARSFPYGAVITNGIYTRDIDYARSIGRKVFMARDDGTDGTNTSYQIIDPMIKNVPEEGSIITVEFDTPSYGAPTLGVNNGIGGLVQVSGKNIHITDSSGQIDSVEMYGDTEQTTYSGKNMLNPNDVQSIFIYSGANKADWSSGNTGVAIIVEQNTTYVVSTTISQARYRVAVCDSIPVRGGGVVTCYNGSNRDGTSSSITINSGTHTYMIVNATDVTKVQLEKSNQATSFEPYVGGTASPNPDYPQEVQTVTGRQVVTISDGGSESQEYEINLGKNLLPFTNQNFTLKGVTFTVTNGTLYLNGTSEGETYANNQMFKDNFSFTLQPGTYILSRNNSSLVTAQIKRFSDGTNLANTNGAYTTAIFTLTEPTKVVFGFYLYQNVFDNVNLELMLEKGSVATTYAPYFTPIELCKIGTYQDYIYKSGDNWYLHKELGEFNLADYKDLTGWYVTGGGEHCVKHMWANNFPITDIKPQPNMTSLGYGLSNYFTECNYADLYNGVEKVGFAFGLDGIYLSDNDWTLASFRTWITGKVVNMYYIKTTPTDTQITNATLIAQLNALYNMLPEGVADVVVTGDLPGSLTIKYYQQGTGTHTAPIVGGAEIDGGDNEQVVELDSYLPYRLVYDTNGYWRVLNKGPKVTTGAIADGAVTPEKLSVNPGKYSTAETIIGSWIDGRPVYRKVLTGTTPEGGATINHGISNFSRILNVGGWVQSGAFGSQPIQRVVTDAIAQYGIGVGDFTSTTFLLQVGSNASVRGKPYTLILEYIKTV